MKQGNKRLSEILLERHKPTSSGTTNSMPPHFVALSFEFVALSVKGMNRLLYVSLADCQDLPLTVAYPNK